MVGPLYGQPQMQRCKHLYRFLTDLTLGGFRLYDTVDNVRALQYYHPEENQLTIKQAHFKGGWQPVLWESHFVNINVEESCSKYVK